MLRHYVNLSSVSLCILRFLFFSVPILIIQILLLKGVTLGGAISHLRTLKSLLKISQWDLGGTVLHWTLKYFQNWCLVRFRVPRCKISPPRLKTTPLCCKILPSRRKTEPYGSPHGIFIKYNTYLSQFNFHFIQFFLEYS